VPAEAKPASASTPEKSAPPRLSVVVLPFANIGGDSEQDHFVDGVTESLTPTFQEYEAPSSSAATLRSPTRARLST
jgi:TolB-like protein